MALTNAGRNLIAGAINGDAFTAFNAANAFLGVGDSSTAFAATQTDLQAATNKAREAVDSAPSLATNVITAVATFETGDANFAWNEWGYFNAAAAGTMLCRKVESLGTKTSSQTWELTATLTVNAA